MAKVTPVQNMTPKENNFIDNEYEVIRRLKHVIITELFVGINRLHLLRCNFIFKWLGAIYVGILLCITASIVTTLTTSEQRGVYSIFRLTACIEYVLLILFAPFLLKNKLHQFFLGLQTFDTTLKINKDYKMTCPITQSMAWIALCILYSVIEYSMLSYYMPNWNRLFIPFWYFTTIAHEAEQMFYVTLIKFVMLRTRVMKGHVLKAFGSEKQDFSNEHGPFESLATNTDLDSSEMHKAYELLHKCADQLNSVMSFPLFTGLFASGLSTTLLLKNLFQTNQSTIEDPLVLRAMVIYATTRCVKLTLLVIVPCYYSSITARQVSVIRTVLHSAIYTLKLDKLERRKIKAFFQLTQDNDFVYAIWGVIKLNMSLPLSYSSLCTTYLVIILQFSKFID